MFLHTLLFSAVLTKKRLLKSYMLLGWATPILFVTPWTVVKILYENTECWSIVNRWFWWIIRGPITLSVLIIFFIFIKILMLLLSKLKADQVTFSDYRYSLARATLVLVPLLGIHEVVFTVLLDECVEGSGRYARNFVHLTLSSFQGFLVAVLYCFANGEVQAELKKRWQLFLFTTTSPESHEEGGSYQVSPPPLLPAALKNTGARVQLQGNKAGQVGLTRKESVQQRRRHDHGRDHGGGPGGEPVLKEM
ncbi:hypothetical protein WMY93_010368 [Mugilogobius chulae]|uniref:G-protein coupled receptors family 2 profile 2 domain-containing protein n=1 Tax=Mugilogobius chulae TaxID=88201 RepID=A0AAW0PG81_9GOBI